MAKYKHVGMHAEELVGGVMVGPGEEVDLDEAGEADNRRLIDEGIFIPLDETTETKTSSTKEET